MARAPFSVSERVTKHGVAWDARFFASDGAVIKTIRIADVKNRTQAIRKAQSLLAEGIIPNTDNPDALEYIASFWRRDSDYVQGHAINRSPPSGEGSSRTTTSTSAPASSPNTPPPSSRAYA